MFDAQAAGSVYRNTVPGSVRSSISWNFICIDGECRANGWSARIGVCHVCSYPVISV